MKHRSIIINISLLAILAITSCKKDSIKPIDIYVAGTSNSKAAYWKNNVETTLGGLNSSANKIVVSGNNVYVAGSITDANQSYNAVYWKNGVVTNLGVGQAFGIAVQGTDVYVVGVMPNINPIPNANPNIPNASVAVVWKNGIVTNLGVGQISDIIISGNDIYMAGYTYTPQGIITATYWKNNAPVNLGPGEADAIAVEGTDVYVTRPFFSQSVQGYWKNGAFVNMGYDGDTEVTGIAVYDNDVYVLGATSSSQGWHATYWKNGKATVLKDGASALKDGTSSFGIAVNGTDVYLAGSYNNINGLSAALYWKNGSVTTLASGGYNRYYAASVAVVSH
jgi:hypothetical protein